MMWIMWSAEYLGLAEYCCGPFRAGMGSCSIQVQEDLLQGPSFWNKIIITGPFLLWPK